VSVSIVKDNKTFNYILEFHQKNRDSYRKGSFRVQSPPNESIPVMQRWAHCQRGNPCVWSSYRVCPDGTDLFLW